MTGASQPGQLDRPVGLTFAGDWGGANLTRVCGWLAHELHERTAGSAHSLIRTGDAGAGNLHAVGRGEADVALVTPSAVAALAQRGAGPFEGGGYPALRALAELPHPDHLLFALRADLGVSTFAELRERRLPLRLATSLDGPDASFAGFAAERVLEASGIAPATLREWGGEVISRDAPFECVAELEAGRADAVFHEAVMTPWWHKLAERHALAFPSFEAEALAVAEGELACAPGELPAGYLNGMDEPVATVEFRGYLVVVRDDMPEDVAALLTWILGETADRFIAMNYAHIPAEHSPIRYPVRREALGDTPIPLHPGAAAYHDQVAAPA